MKLRLVYRDRWVLYAVCTDRGDCPLLEFLSSEDSSSHLAKTKRQMLRRLEAIARSGVPQSPEISHQISGDVWQIGKGDLRVLYFYDRNRIIILSHGFVKKSRKTPQSEIQRAQEALQRYRAERDRIEILED
jgi:phage-related protein